MKAPVSEDAANTVSFGSPPPGEVVLELLLEHAAAISASAIPTTPIVFLMGSALPSAMRVRVRI